jgi:CubicO group peptidase (beta-lactamase class C family)
MKNFFLYMTIFIVGCLSFAFFKIQDGDRQSLIENGLRSKVVIEGESEQKMNLLDRMRFYQVPGVSIAVINEGKVDFAKGFGHISSDPKSEQVNEHTLFQAGSISKSFTAFGALILVQQGKLSMDEDVNLYLKRWKVPENEHTKTEKVTLRRLLSHTAGTNVGGFPGYSKQVSIPTTLEVLKGKKPLVNSDPISVTSEPGSEFRYSGGGTTIVQLLIEDLTGESFEAWMQKNVLKPLGMNESTFIQPLPSAYAIHAAHGYHLHGKAVEGNWHIYPEMAAAGLWSTPNDMAELVLYIQSALKGEKTSPLKPEWVKEMITRQTARGKEIDSGLGVFLEGQGSDLNFSHNGQDEGFIAKLLGYAYLGKGAIIMMNNDAGWILMNELTNSVADAYGWPHYESIKKKIVTVDQSHFDVLPGKYVSGEESINVTISDNKIFIDTGAGVGPVELLPSGKCTFFIREDAFTFEFSDCQGVPDQVLQIDSKNQKVIYKRLEKNVM